MSETSHSYFKQTIVIVIVLLLILFVGAQTWYMFRMKKQLQEIYTQQSSIERNAGSTLPAAAGTSSNES